MNSASYKLPRVPGPVRGLVLAAVLLAAGATGVLVVSLVHYRESSSLVDRTHEALRQISAMQADLLRADSNERGWILSGNAAYVDAYRDATASVVRSLEALDKLAVGDRMQWQRLAKLHSMIEQRLDALARVVKLGPDRRDEALAILDPDGRQAASAIASTVDAMRRAEIDRLAERRGAADRAAMYSTLAASTLALLALAGTGLATWLFHRQRMPVKLRSANAGLEAFLAALPDAIVCFDQAGIIDTFNATAERMFGLSANDARGRTFKSLFPAYAGDGLPDQAVVAQRADGSTFAAKLSVRDWRFDGTTRFVALVHDMSEAQARDPQTEPLRGDLLHASRLISMGEMASALAHELNQPLTALAAYLQGAIRLLGQRGDKDAVAIGALERATAQALRAGDVIRRLREFVTKGETERRIESLAVMVQEAWTLAVVAESDRTTQIDIALDPATDLVLANKIQIEQVLLNLIRNGLEAMRQTRRRRLVISSTPAAGGMVRISVADSGPGIAADVAARLFQPFTTTKASGLGVGLSISRTIVEAHGGQISAEPNPDGGAIFYFTLRSGLLKDDEYAT